MKKITTLLSVSAFSIMLVSAMTSDSNMDMKMGVTMKGSMPERTMNMEGKMPEMLTGDAVVDAQLRILNKEMADKIKSIMLEYQAKIKAAIGDKKLKVGMGMPFMASSTSSSTRPMKETRKEAREEMRGDMKDMKGDMKDKREEMKGDMKDMREEMKDKRGEMRNEMKDAKKENNFLRNFMDRFNN